MSETLNNALGFILLWEGGYINHPSDPGGATNFGVTQTTYNTYRKKIAYPLQSVKLISKAEVLEIYKTMYWDKIHGDDLPESLSISLMDWAVNAGVKRAVSHLQQALNVTVDGVFGPKTLEAAKKCGEKELKEFLSIRENYYLKLGKKKPMFLKGWLNRLNDLKKFLKL